MHAMYDFPQLKQCTVILTRECNLRCDFCYAKDAKYRVQDRFSFENFKKIADFCIDSGVKFIFFTGGEPIMHPQFFEFLAYIKNNSTFIQTAVASNGVLLKDKDFCQQLVNSGLSYIDISMKGVDENEWLQSTGFTGHKDQLQGISNIASLPIEFTCSMVVTHSSVNNLCKQVLLAKQAGARQFSFTFLIDNSSNTVKGLQYLQQHNPAQLIDKFLSQYNELNSLTNDWWVEYSFPLCMYTEKQLELLKNRLASPCQVHHSNALTINNKLECFPCDCFFDDKLGVLGKDFKNLNEFNVLRASEYYQTIMHDKTKLRSAQCSQCKLYNQCYGGCPVLWRHYSFNDMHQYLTSYQNNIAYKTIF